jgi:hypothetical protein
MTKKTPELHKIKLLRQYSRKLKSLNNMADKLEELCPDAAKIKEINNKVSRQVTRIYAKFLKAFEKALVNKYVASDKPGFKNIVIMTHNGKSTTRDICPENVILSTTKSIKYDTTGYTGSRRGLENIDQNTNILYVVQNKKYNWREHGTVAPIVMSKSAAGYFSPVSTGWELNGDEDGDPKVIDILIDLMKAYDVVSGSVKFKEYLRDQLVNNVL